jgi:hypothetical protein
VGCFLPYSKITQKVSVAVCVWLLNCFYRQITISFVHLFIFPTVRMLLSSEIVQGAVITLALAPLFSLLQSRLGFVACFSAIAAFSGLKLAFDLNTLLGTPNYYSRLEVNRHSSTMDVRQAYKRLSLKLHPDKNPSSESIEKFAKVKAAYDVLMDEKSRDLLNRFGDLNLKTDPRSDELQLIGEIAVRYLFWMLLTFVATASTSTRVCRTWAAIVLLSIMGVEVAFALTETSLPQLFSGQWTEYEIVTMLHCVYPCIVLGLRSVAESVFVDVNDASVSVISELTSAQASVQGLLCELEASLAPDSSTTDDFDNIHVKVVGIRGAMQAYEAKAMAGIERLRKSSANPGSSYYWLIFVALYGGVYLLQE